MDNRRSFFVHQIYYDEDSRRQLDPGFVPLDNTRNERPDWFEFWVIRRFLLDTPLQDDAWYGFFSPRFRAKTGLSASQVMDFLESAAPQADVALFSHRWDQIAYYLNVFEQGETLHHGLLDLSQQFFSSIGMEVNLRDLVTHSRTAVFSNFIVAKPVFWREWLPIANSFFAYVEDSNNAQSGAIKASTFHGYPWKKTPMKTFIQERFASVLLALGEFRVAAIDLSADAPLTPYLFEIDPRTRRRLQACDVLKQAYCASVDQDYLSAYRKLRALVPVREL